MAYKCTDKIFHLKCSQIVLRMIILNFLNMNQISKMFLCIFLVFLVGCIFASALHTYKDIETVRKLILSTLSFSSAWYIALTEIV